MRYVVLCAMLLAVAASGCGGGSGGGGKSATTTSAWQVDEPEYTPGNVTSLVVTPDGGTAYLTNGASLLTFDVDARQLQAHSHPTDRSVVIAAVNDDVSQLYLLPSAIYIPFPPFTRSLVAFAPPTGAQTLISATSTVGPAAYAKGFVFVASSSTPTVDAISTTNGQGFPIELPSSGGSIIRSIARTPEGGSILVGDPSAAALHVIDPILRKVLYSIPIGIAANRILPIDEDRAIVLGPNSFETVDITDPTIVPDVHPYPFDEALESDAPGLLIDDGRRLLIARRAAVDHGLNDGDPELQPELIVIDIATGAVRDQTRLLEPEPFDYEASYQLAPTADPSTFIFAYEDAIYIMHRTAPF